MKRKLLILVVLTLLALPTAALAATEFSLGGFINLETFWDSTQQGRSMTTAIARNNDRQFQHGRFYMTAQASRFNFTIKGPKIWGAQLTGLIEMDFDGTADATGLSSTHSYSPRLRHAMFRLNWPDTQLLFGQYWAFDSEFGAEVTQQSGLQFHGTFSHRVPQISLTQKYCEWTFGAMVAKPEDMADINSPTKFGSAGAYTLNNPGPNSETPQLEGKVTYEKDLWGKAAYFGVPRGFVAQVVAGWQRSRFQYGQVADRTFNNFTISNAATRDNQNLDNWMVQGTLFIPVVPCYSPNLAGTASLLAQWWVGQGLEAFSNGRKQDDSFFVRQTDTFVGDTHYTLLDRKLTRMFGGWVQGQYWFTNQWYLNVAWGMSRAFGISRDDLWANANGEPMKLWNEIDGTLWYRPIQALKFGLQYSYGRTDYFFKKFVNDGNPQDRGEAHRVMSVCYFYF